MSGEAWSVFNMWNLSRKHGIRPWEQSMDYDEKGNPIVYKDDMDALNFLDGLERDGKAREDWLSSKRSK
jgi:hypothetical protein